MDGALSGPWINLKFKYLEVNGCLEILGRWFRRWELGMKREPIDVRGFIIGHLTLINPHNFYNSDICRTYPS